MVMHRTRAIGSWTYWERENQAENSCVILPQLQLTTCMSNMKELARYYRIIVAREANNIASSRNNPGYLKTQTPENSSLLS